MGEALVVAGGGVGGGAGVDAYGSHPVLPRFGERSIHLLRWCPWILSIHAIPPKACLLCKER